MIALAVFALIATIATISLANVASGYRAAREARVDAGVRIAQAARLAALESDAEAVDAETQGSNIQYRREGDVFILVESAAGGERVLASERVRVDADRGCAYDVVGRRCIESAVE